MNEINRLALFHDGSSDFIRPSEPNSYEEVIIVFRTGLYDVDEVYFCENHMVFKMERVRNDELFSYYELRKRLRSENIFYHFRLIKGDEKCIYDMTGAHANFAGQSEFTLSPDFKTPNWAKGAVMYQLFVDRFYNGDKSNDVETNEYHYVNGGTKKVDDWEKYPAVKGVNEFYGGDLQGVLDKLDYLQKLGIEVIYFNPLFVSPSNHKYDIQDYEYIDPHYTKIVKDGGELLKEGDIDNKNASKYIMRVTDQANLEASNEFFVYVMEEIHKRGMKVILDGVFNHCGSFNKWLDKEKIYENQSGYKKGAYLSKDSPYNNYFDFRKKEEWPDNNSYDGWWGYDTLPKLNYEKSIELYDYIMYIGRKWVSPPYNVDGWRLDVAADLGYSEEFNHRFWKDFRRNVKEANPEALILAEHYGDPNNWLQGREWDSIMNYDAFMEPISWFLTGMEKHSDSKREDLIGNTDAFSESMLNAMTKFQFPALLTAMNQLSNHDHSRFMTRTNGMVGRTATAGTESANHNIDKCVFKEAVIMQMTWPGAPTLYYGDEAGVCGWTDPDNRRTYPWGNEDMELIEFYRDAIRIHKRNKALKEGSFKHLYSEHSVLIYGRFLGDNKLVTIVNNSNQEKELKVPVWQIGGLDNEILERLLLSGKDSYNVGKVPYIIADGNAIIRMPSKAAGIFRVKL